MIPGHTGVVPVMTPGVAGVAGFTVMGIVLLSAVVGDAQIAFEVNITCTTSPFASDEVIKVELFEPAFTPFTCH